MSGVGGGGRRNLSCARGQPMDDGTPLAPVGNGRPRAAGPFSKDGQGHAAGDPGPGAPPADSHTKREKQWPHFGKSATRSAKGSRSVHRRTTNRSSMACCINSRRPRGACHGSRGTRAASVQADLKLLPEGTNNNTLKGEIHLRWRDHTQLLKYMEMVHGKTALENR